MRLIECSSTEFLNGWGLKGVEDCLFEWSWIEGGWDFLVNAWEFSMVRKSDEAYRLLQYFTLQWLGVVDKPCKGKRGGKVTENVKTWEATYQLYWIPLTFQVNLRCWTHAPVEGNQEFCGSGRRYNTRHKPQVGVHSLTIWSLMLVSAVTNPNSESTVWSHDL